MNNKETGKRSSWQSAASKLMLATDTGGKANIGDAAQQLALALSVENRLDFDNRLLRRTPTK